MTICTLKYNIQSNKYSFTYNRCDYGMINGLNTIFYESIFMENQANLVY